MPTFSPNILRKYARGLENADVVIAAISSLNRKSENREQILILINMNLLKRAQEQTDYVTSPDNPDDATGLVFEAPSQMIHVSNASEEEILSEVGALFDAFLSLSYSNIQLLSPLIEMIDKGARSFDDKFNLDWTFSNYKDDSELNKVYKAMLDDDRYKMLNKLRDFAVHRYTVEINSSGGIMEVRYNGEDYEIIGLCESIEDLIKEYLNKFSEELINIINKKGKERNESATTDPSKGK